MEKQGYCADGFDGPDDERCGHCGKFPIPGASNRWQWAAEADRLEREAKELRASYDARREWRGEDGEFYPEIKQASAKQTRALELRDLVKLSKHLADGGIAQEWIEDIFGNGFEADYIFDGDRTLASMVHISPEEAELLEEKGAECAVIWWSDLGNALEFGTLAEWKAKKAELESEESSDE